MTDIQKMLREMRLYADENNYGPDVGRWLIAIEAAMREPAAELVRTSTGSEWAFRLMDPPIDTKLFAFPPDAAGEIKKITEAHEDALLDVQTALNEAKGDAEDWHDSYDSIVEEFRMRGAEIERLKRLLAGIVAEAREFETRRGPLKGALRQWVDESEAALAGKEDKG